MFHIAREPIICLQIGVDIGEKVIFLWFGVWVHLRFPDSVNGPYSIYYSFPSFLHKFLVCG